MTKRCDLNWEFHNVSIACKEDNCFPHHCEHHRYEQCTCEQRCMLCNDPKKKDFNDPYDHQKGCNYYRMIAPEDICKECYCDDEWFSK